VIEQVETADKVVLGFVLHARHSGLLRSSLGDVQATGREVAVRTIDVLTVRDGRVAEIVVVSDEAGLLQQLGVAVAPRPEG
jgi:ketosteroid isomerase-like protein